MELSAPNLFFQSTESPEGHCVAPSISHLYTEFCNSGKILGMFEAMACSVPPAQIVVEEPLL